MLTTSGGAGPSHLSKQMRAVEMADGVSLHRHNQGMSVRNAATADTSGWAPTCDLSLSVSYQQVDQINQMTPNVTAVGGSID